MVAVDSPTVYWTDNRRSFLMRKNFTLFLLLLPICGYSQDQYLVDWDSVGEETIDHLVDLVRINTMNPPGNETDAANYLKAALAQEGIDSQMYALDPARANLVARIKGNGSKRPILIMGHTDVVGIQADRWTEDPFGGARKDGYIYGRGTLDDKDNATAALMVMKMLKRYGVELDRDIIFLAESGEEGTPDVGINFMVEKHWDAIAAEYCLAEGGGNILTDNGVSMVGISTTEKMPRRATLVAQGTPGHGSIPRIDNAVTILANAVAKAGAWETEMRLTFPYYYSILRTSVVPTVMDAGFRKNVIPSEASAILDIRMLPDEDVDGFYLKLAEVIDDPRVTVVPEPIYRPAGTPSAIDNEMFQSIESAANQLYPDATVLPTMLTGATDMAQVRAKGTASYGFGASSTLAELTGGRGAHGDDERISEEAMKQLVQFLWYIIIDIAAAK